MNHITSKSGICRLSMFFVIFLISEFEGENAFSQQPSKKDILMATYDYIDQSISFDFLFYDYNFALFNKHGYLKVSNIDYSEDGNQYTCLIKAETKEQNNYDLTWITMKYKKPGENIQLLNCYNLGDAVMWADDGKEFNVQVHVTNMRVKRGRPNVIKRAYMSVKWQLPPSCKCIKSVRIKGSWKVSSRVFCNEVNEIHTMDIERSNSSR